MKRRTFLLGASGSTFAGSAVIGSGAFSRAEADRSIAVQVAEDPDAYLGLDSCDSPNGDFAHLDDAGRLEILMNDENPAAADSPLGEGVNADSTSEFDRVFQVCNQGREEACVWISDDENWPRVEGGEHADERRVDFYLEDDRGRSLVGEENAISLGVGECVCLGIRTRTHGLEAGDALLEEIGGQITINADADGSCPGVACAALDAEYECTLFDNESGGEMWPIVGHEITVANGGDGAAAYFWATIGEEQDDYWPFDDPIVAESGAANTTRIDTDYPVRGLVWWTGECTTGTIGEYEDFFDEHAFLDLDDVDATADAVPVTGFPSVADLEESANEGEAVGDVVDCGS